MDRTYRSSFVSSAVWATLIALAAGLDVIASQWVHDNKPLNSVGFVRTLMWWMGHFSATAIIACLLIIRHVQGLRGALLLILAAACCGIVTSLMKWTVGRVRPFKGCGAFEFNLFRGGWASAIHGYPNLTFPSGHASLVFATAGILHFLIPRQAWLFYALAGAVAAFRVLEGAHYPSDIVAGAAVGVWSAHTARFLCRLSVLSAVEESLPCGRPSA